MRIPMTALATGLALAASVLSSPRAQEAAPDRGASAVGGRVPGPPSPKASATGPAHAPGPGTAGTPNTPAIVGGTPGAVIGGTPTAGPPGTGGPAGGPSLSGQ